MKFISILMTVFALMMGPALAGDVHDWSGGYIGVHGGYAWGSASVSDTSPGVVPGPFNYPVAGALGGVQAGYNFQTGNIVFGPEVDVGYASASGSGVIGSSHAASHQDLTLSGGAYADLTGRLGVGFGNTLLYAKGGAALYGGRALQQTTNPNYVGTPADGFLGWVAGVGLEQALTENVSVKVEYDHYGFGTGHGYQTAIAADPPTPAGYKFDNWTNLGFDTVKVGLNWKF